MWHSNSRQWLVTDKQQHFKKKKAKKQTELCNDEYNFNNSSKSNLSENNARKQQLFENTNTNTNTNKKRHRSHINYYYDGYRIQYDEMLSPTVQTTNKYSKRNILYNRHKNHWQTTTIRIHPKSNAAVKQLYKVLNQKILVLLLAIYLAQGHLTPFSETYAHAQELPSSANGALDFVDVSSYNTNIWQREQRLNSLSNSFQQQQQINYKISPKPCTIGGIDGTCMFVWECIKSEGRHVGMCVDAFMFGSCCVHNYTENIVMPPSFAYTRPTKPLYTAHQQYHHKPRPPPFASPHRPPAVPGISGMTTIERPHGAGTLVIRPSGPHHQRPYGSLQRPRTTTTTTRPTTKQPITTKQPMTNDMQTAASLREYPTNQENSTHT